MRTGMGDPDDLRDQVALLSAEVGLLRERLNDRDEALRTILDSLRDLRAGLEQHATLLAKARLALRPGAEWERRERGW